jgi:hypothetical protein
VPGKRAAGARDEKPEASPWTGAAETTALNWHWLSAWKLHAMQMPSSAQAREHAAAFDVVNEA